MNCRVVNKSFFTKSISIAGVPTKIVPNKGNYYDSLGKR